LKLDQIMNVFDSKTEYVCVEDDMAFVLDKDTFATKRVYTRSGEDFEEVDFLGLISRTAEYLKDKVDAAALLREFLKNLHPKEALKIAERVEKKPAVSSKDEKCYSLTIGGKRGRPMELCLVHNAGYDT